MLLLAIGLTPVVYAQTTASLPLPTPQPTPGPVQVGSAIPAPCINAIEANQLAKAGVSSIIPKCADYFSPKSPFKFINGFYDFFKRRIECYYEGYIVPNFKDGTKEGQNEEQCSQSTEVSASAGAKRITCSINDGEGVLNGSNSSPNHLGEACGNFSAQNGTWEIAQFTGLGVQAMKFYREQVATEMVTKNSLTITSAMCQGQASDYLLNWVAAKNLSYLVLTSMTKSQLATLAANGNPCNPSAVNPTDTNIGACYIYSSMNQLSLLFSYLAECEALRRFEGFNADLTDNHLNGLKSVIEDCTRQGDDYGNKWDVLSEDAGRARGASCYAQKVQGYFRNIVSTMIPGNFTSQPPSNLVGP